MRSHAWRIQCFLQY